MDDKPSLETSREKVRRAKEHLDTLKGEINDFVSTAEAVQPYPVTSEIDPETGETIFRLSVSKPAPTLRFGVLVGDIIHNLRSSLDYIIEQLTLRDSRRSLKRTEFPVFIDPAKYNKLDEHGKPATGSGLWKIRGIKDTHARALIEGAQPFSGIADPVDAHPLWGLHSLWNMDKHRLPPVVASTTLITQRVVADASFEGVFDVVAIEAKLRNVFPYEDGAEVGRLPLIAEKSPKANVECYGSVEVIFGESSPTPKGLKVISGCNSILLMTDNLIQVFDRFF